MIRCLAVACCAAGVALVACLGLPRLVDGPAGARGYALTAVASAPGMRDFPFFTFQGVFTDPATGEPIAGPAGFRIGIGDGPFDSDPIVTLTDASPVYTDGRFTVEVELISAQSMLAIEDPHICVVSDDGNDTPLIPRIPMRHAPYAWAAEHAAFAERADEALLAESARRLLGSLTVPLTPADGWGGDIEAIRVGQMVFLSGRAGKTTSLASNTVTVLPASVRPETDLYFSIIAGSSSFNGSPIRCAVLADGTVRIESLSTAVPQIYLNGVVFPAFP